MSIIKATANQSSSGGMAKVMSHALIKSGVSSASTATRKGPREAVCAQRRDASFGEEQYVP